MATIQCSTFDAIHMPTRTSLVQNLTKHSFGYTAMMMLCCLSYLLHAEWFISRSGIFFFPDGLEVLQITAVKTQESMYHRPKRCHGDQY
jgi:hypothetical protein